MGIADRGGVASDSGSRPGRTALVTGAGSGIGRATVLALCAEGYNVVASDIDLDAANATVAATDGFGSAKAAWVDVSSRESVRRLVDETLSEFGSLDLGFNSAAVRGDGNSIVDTPDEHVRSLVEVNLLGVWHSMAEELRVMVAKGGGLIVNAASATALRAAPGLAAYAMCKAAVVHASRSAARENAPHGVRVIALCPGPVNTPMLGHLDEEAMRRIVASVPLGRLGEPEEIARVVLWLDSTDAAYVTGAVLPLDGGESA